MKRDRRFFYIMAVLLLLTMYFLGKGMAFVTADAKLDNIVVAIDAGHGGNDPGKTVGDVNEKDINLSIAKKLKAPLEEEGITVIMTREEDKGLYKEADSNKKVTDMKNRCELINSNKVDLLISIHQNSYPQESVKGAQCFYYKASAEGEKLASILQEKLIEKLDNKNTRKAKANDSYYILLNVSSPAVIVECGFLTNNGERKKLQEEQYQDNIALAIKDGVISYFTEK